MYVRLQSCLFFVSSRQVNWQQERFQEITSKLGHFLKQAGFKVHVFKNKTKKNIKKKKNHLLKNSMAAHNTWCAVPFFEPSTAVFPSRSRTSTASPPAACQERTWQPGVPPQSSPRGTPVPACWSRSVMHRTEHSAFCKAGIFVYLLYL